jgi:hypothetical protein
MSNVEFIVLVSARYVHVEFNLLCGYAFICYV